MRSQSLLQLCLMSTDMIQMAATEDLNICVQYVLLSSEVLSDMSESTYTVQVSSYYATMGLFICSITSHVKIFASLGCLLPPLRLTSSYHQNTLKKNTLAANRTQI